MNEFQSLLSQRPVERQPCLTFSPPAWLKLQWFCHVGDTEVGGFGIVHSTNLLYVEDFLTVKQHVTWASVRFDDVAVADFIDGWVDHGLSLEQCGRIWLHTHPGESVTPSGTDEETFARCFGRCDWAVMFILGRTGKTYARLRFAAGPGADLTIPTAVDWAAWPRCCAGQRQQLAEQFARWQEEYAANVHFLPNRMPALPVEVNEQPLDEQWWNLYPWSEELDEICYEPADTPFLERTSDEFSIKQFTAS